MTRICSGQVPLIGAAALVFVLAAPPAQASPLDLFGVGGRSPAMAGTGVADTSSYEAAFLNPAGVDLRRDLFA